MIVLSQVLKEQGRGREDIQQALRGSRQPNYRAAKNVVRLIRLRLAAKIKTLEGVGNGNGFSAGVGAGAGVLDGRSEVQHGQGLGVVDDDRLYSLYRTSTAAASTPHSLTADNGVEEGAGVRTSKGAGGGALAVGAEESESAVYSSESEVISALMTTSVNPSYPEAYQRCCKVLMRIANLSQAKHFFWEIDSVMFPDYYSSIRRPMMIANVAARLVSQAYGTESAYICDQFYADMRQVVLNCFAFNTEVTAVHAQAQKIQQVSQSVSQSTRLPVSIIVLHPDHDTEHFIVLQGLFKHLFITFMLSFNGPFCYLHHRCYLCLPSESVSIILQSSHLSSHTTPFFLSFYDDCRRYGGTRTGN
jgi:Bromodomain